mmetsp:Transcript_14791/g.35728  ORF Transcript_14791/g.35728 Transcript_14791/m.35728 type:complete len:508 (+) Transcript_14791:42-1565(+)
MEEMSSILDEEVEERDLSESRLLQSSPTSPSESLPPSSPTSDASWWRQNCNLLELSGSCGDFGTLIPLLVALGRQRAIYLAPTLLGTGIVHIISGGLIWDIPMPLQPMKAIASLAIASELTRLEVSIAGLGMGICFLLFGIFGGAIETLHRWIPPSVIGGLQLGVGWKLAVKGIHMIQELPWIENPYDSKFWSIFSGLLCLYFLKAQQSSSRNDHSRTVGCWQKFRQQFPVGLSLFLLGVLLAIMKLVNTRHTDTNDSSSVLDQEDVIQSTPEAFVVNALRGATWGDWKTGILEGTLPQLPLTTLNSCLSVCLLAKSLFPDKPAVERRTVCWSIGLMNLLLCPLGCMPHCHGAGGLAGQNKLGAKSGLSMVVLGLFKIILSILTHYGYILTLFDALPVSILGVLLVIAGHELALTGVSSVAYPKESAPWTASAPGKQPDLTVTLMTGLIIVGTGKTHVGTLCGLLAHLLNDSGNLERRNSNDEVTGDTDRATEDNTGSEEYAPLHRE